MSCKIYKEMLHSYINKELNPFEASEVTKHLAVCPECRRQEAEILSLKAIAAELRPPMLPLDGLKESIMSAITTVKKVRPPSYDIRVLGSLGTSLVACGVLALFLNFSAVGSGLEASRPDKNPGWHAFGQRIVQPVAAFNKSLMDISDKLFDLNGITFRLENKFRGGM